jgi:hypothetical protein
MLDRIMYSKAVGECRRCTFFLCSLTGRGVAGEGRTRDNSDNLAPKSGCGELTTCASDAQTSILPRICQGSTDDAEAPGTRKSAQGPAQSKTRAGHSPQYGTERVMHFP